MRVRSFLPEVCAVLALLLPAHAERNASAEDGYQTATVVSVTRDVAGSSTGGENPVDAPLRARYYTYSVGFRLNCTLYVGRYDSEIKYLPSPLVPNREVDVRLGKHVLYVNLPFADDDLQFGVVRRRRIKDESCRSLPANLPQSLPSHPFVPGSSKGERS